MRCPGGHLPGPREGLPALPRPPHHGQQAQAIQDGSRPGRRVAPGRRGGLAVPGAGAREAAGSARSPRAWPFPERTGCSRPFLPGPLRVPASCADEARPSVITRGDRFSMTSQADRASGAGHLVRHPGHHARPDHTAIPEREDCPRGHIHRCLIGPEPDDHRYPIGARDERRPGP